MSLNRIKIIIFIFFLWIVCSPGFGQVLSSAELKLLTVLNTGSGIPKDLLQTKSIIVISINDGESNFRNDWRSLAEEAHFYIKKLGIDAVLYFYIDDLIAGFDVQRAVSNQMVDRDIKNILMLSKDKVNGRDQFIGVLTSFNEQPTFISNNQEAWKSQTSDLEILFRNLARAIDNANLTLENLLIIDSPEYFRGIDIIRGKRFESLNTDLRIDRLAVPKFTDLQVPENTGTTTGGSMIARIEEENEKKLQRNSQLEQLMEDYPYKFEIIPYEYDERKLLSKGFQFVLMRINSAGRNVREILGYEVNNGNEELVTNRETGKGEANNKLIPDNAMVYKYYVKHINSGDIYLGEQWDGDDTWQDALNNHITNIIDKLAK